MHFPSISVCSEGAALPGEPSHSSAGSRQRAHSVQADSQCQKESARQYSIDILAETHIIKVTKGNADRRFAQGYKDNR